MRTELRDARPKRFRTTEEEGQDVVWGVTGIMAETIVPDGPKQRRRRRRMRALRAMERLGLLGEANGANIAASLVLSRPDLLRGAVLLRPMVPFEPEALPDLSGIRIFVAAGELDQMVPKENTEYLVELLRDAGAEIQIRWQRTGHGLAREEVEEAKRWLSHAVYDETAGMG